MPSPGSLYLYEEILLLALRDDKGTLATGFIAQALAGAALAELLLAGRICVEESRKQLVDIHDTRRFEDPVMDACLLKMEAATRRAALRTWVNRLASIRGLHHTAAQQLCRRGILRADEDKVLFIFTRKIYPEINPTPERRILERLRRAIFEDSDRVDPRTAILVALAQGTGLLNQAFGRKELKVRKRRIEQIVNGDVVGKATKEVIAACQAAMTAAIVAATAATTAATSH